MARRPVPLPARSFSARAKRWSAYRRKIRPRTGTEYSDDFSFELARSSSADAQRRFSISEWLFAILPASSGIPAVGLRKPPVDCALQVSYDDQGRPAILVGTKCVLGTGFGN